MFFQVFQWNLLPLVCLGQFVIHVAKFTKIKETLLTILTHIMETNIVVTCVEMFFSSKRKIFKHVHKYKFNCKECSITCKTSTSLKNHYMKVHEGKVFECSTCSLTFQWEKNLKSHEKVHKKILGEKNIFQCNLCEKTFRHKRSLTTHMKVHQEANEYSCSQCLKSFPTQYELKKHKRSVHGEGQMDDLTCSFCKINFKSKANHMKHMRRKHNSNSVLYNIINGWNKIWSPLRKSRVIPVSHLCTILNVPAVSVSL